MCIKFSRFHRHPPELKLTRPGSSNPRADETFLDTLEDDNYVSDRANISDRSLMVSSPDHRSGGELSVELLSARLITHPLSKTFLTIF